jgi:hypothetical protein
VAAVAVVAIIGAVIIFRKNGQPPELAKSTEKTEQKEDPPAPPPSQKPADAKNDRATATKKETPGVVKAEPVARVANTPTAMLALPRGGRPFELRALYAKPESTQNPSGTPIQVDVPFDRVKWFAAPENRVAQDAVIVWQVNADNASGERMAVDTYSGTTGMRVGRFEFDGDGKGLKCDVSPDGKLFVAASGGGKITVWNLADKTTPLNDFDPYADKPDQQKAGLAAVFFASNSTDLVTVSTAGAIHLVEIATRKPLAELVLPRGSPGRVAMGRTVAADAGRASVVVAVGGVIYQVATTVGLPIFWKLELGGEVGRSFGIAAVGAPGRVAFAFETDADKKKEKAVLFCRPDEKPIVHRWPEAAGEPTGIHWAGGNMAVIATTRGAMWVDTEGKAFLPVALAEVPGGKALHSTTEISHWYLLPASGDAAKSLLLELTLPPANLIDFRNAAEAKQPVATLRLDERGLWK